MNRTGELHIAKAAAALKKMRGLDKASSGAVRYARSVSRSVTSPSMPASSLGSAPASEPQVTRMHRSLPVVPGTNAAGVSTLTPAAINETGEVVCPRRMYDRVARDRCVQYQAKGCSCTHAHVVREAHRMHREEERERARIKAQIADRPRASLSSSPPWQLVCGWEPCGRSFQAKRSWNAKPKYCSKKCYNAASYRAKKLREAAEREATP